MQSFICIGIFAVLERKTERYSSKRALKSQLYSIFFVNLGHNLFWSLVWGIYSWFIWGYKKYSYICLVEYWSITKPYIFCQKFLLIVHKFGQLTSWWGGTIYTILMKLFLDELGIVDCILLRPLILSADEMWNLLHGRLVLNFNKDLL